MYRPYVGRLKLTASAFNWLQQSWLQSPLLRRTHRFFPSRGRSHFGTHCTYNGGVASWVSLSGLEYTVMVYTLQIQSPIPVVIVYARRNLTLFTWPMPLSLHKTIATHTHRDDLIHAYFKNRFTLPALFEDMHNGKHWTMLFVPPCRTKSPPHDVIPRKISVVTRQLTH